MNNAMNELGQILRGEHTGWTGDRRMNGYRFLTQLSESVNVKALAWDITNNLSHYAEETGISPATLRIATKILNGDRPGML